MCLSFIVYQKISFRFLSDYCVFINFYWRFTIGGPFHIDYLMTRPKVVMKCINFSNGVGYDDLIVADPVKSVIAIFIYLFIYFVCVCGGVIYY